jgi:CheY-like chemotaxis protein
MSSFGKILIIDDDRQFLEAYEDVLGHEGFQVETVTTGEAALRRLDEEPDFDVVLLDMRLRGGKGPNDGLDLISGIQIRAPFAKILVVTGFADAPKPVRDAFQAGVYDFLAKQGPQFQALLLAKVRNALELVRERRLGSLADAEREQAILTLHGAARAETNPQRKGVLLEQLMILLFRSIPGFSRITTRLRNDVEEIDLVIRNESRDAFWASEGSAYILVECKNWTSPVGALEFNHFRSKLEERFGRCRLGFFVAPGGFASTFDLKHSRRSTQDIVIVPLGPEALSRLIASADRNEELKRLHEETVMAVNGKHA